MVACSPYNGLMLCLTNTINLGVIGGKEVDILGVSSDSEEETVNDESMDIEGFTK